MYATPIEITHLHAIRTTHTKIVGVKAVRFRVLKKRATSIVLVDRDQTQEPNHGAPRAAIAGAALRRWSEILWNVRPHSIRNRILGKLHQP